MTLVIEHGNRGLLWEMLEAGHAVLMDAACALHNDSQVRRLDNMLEALRKQLHRLWQDARHGPVRPPVASGWEGV